MRVTMRCRITYATWRGALLLVVLQQVTAQPTYTDASGPAGMQPPAAQPSEATVGAFDADLEAALLEHAPATEATDQLTGAHLGESARLDRSETHTDLQTLEPRTRSCP